MQYSIQHISELLAARMVQSAQANAPIEDLLLDSRHVTAPAVSLFFAIAGKRHDGHRYLQAAWTSGVRNFVVSDASQLPELPESNVLLVQDTLQALQALAAQHRKVFQLPVLGITGSNGKTIVKEWLYQLLAPDFNIVRSPKSYNSRVGVPLSVWQLQEQHNLAIFEAGISQPGEMELLEKIIQPTIGIFTNIGPAHREGFASKTEKVAEKMRLFDHSSVLIYCRDDEKIEAATQKWKNANPDRQLISWSDKKKEAQLNIRKVQVEADGTSSIFGSFEGTDEEQIRIPFSDAASVENAIHCWLTLHFLNIPPERIRERMLRLEPVEMRLELKAAIQGCTLINDAYNNDLNSLRIALRFANQQTRNRQLTLILSDILQSGQTEALLYEKVAAAMLDQKVTKLIAIGPRIPILQEKLPAGFDAVFYPDTEHFIQNINRHSFQNEIILLKGARTFAFERIARRLEQKAHKTVLEVNLSSMIHNLNVYNRLLQPGAKMLAMVKATAYGSGSAEVAKLLEFHQVDYLGVAYADEGIELRHAGVNLPILVLNPEPASFDVLYRFGLEPEVYSLTMLEEMIHFAGSEKTLSIHLKLDTGMHRLGFEPRDIAALCARLRDCPNIKVRSVFTHLAASDDTRHDAFTHRQAAAFVSMYEPIAAALGYRPLRHVCNTGGIARFPEYHFDMVRLGIGLYGIDSSGLQNRLKVVNTLKATISQIKQIAPGETVGYNRNGVVDTQKRIATISIGYADGFLRLAGGGRYKVLVHGQKAPTIGNVCMDMTMIDVSAVPDAREGDEVILFGEQLPVQELADCLQTIPYEIFTNISERVKRVYWQE